MRIAVAGGTGVVGAAVVEAAQAGGHDAVVISRSAGVDIVTGEGVAKALDGVDAVIDTSNVVTNVKRTAIAFFETATRNLVHAGAEAGVRHFVALSIVGIERVPFAYYQGKLAQERAVAESPVPWTVVRATQFHEFPGQLLDRFRGPVAVVPRMRSATVAAREVGAHLLAVAEREPQGMAPDFAGPEVHEMTDLVRKVLAVRGSRRKLLPIRLPGRAGRAMAGGGLLPQGGVALRGTETFDEWLAARR